MKKNCKDVIVGVHTSSFSSRMSWTLGEYCGGKKYMDYQTVSQECCIPTGEHTLTLTSSHGGWGSSYLTLNGHM